MTLNCVASAAFRVQKVSRLREDSNPDLIQQPESARLSGLGVKAIIKIWRLSLQDTQACSYGLLDRSGVRIFIDHIFFATSTYTFCAHSGTFGMFALVPARWRLCSCDSAGRDNAKRLSCNGVCWVYAMYAFVCNAMYRVSTCATRSIATLCFSVEGLKLAPFGLYVWRFDHKATETSLPRSQELTVFTKEA